MASKSLLAALCVVALLAVRSESHGLGDFPSGETTPQMQNFFKPEAAALPESLDGSSMPAATMAAIATARPAGIPVPAVFLLRASWPLTSTADSFAS